MTRQSHYFYAFRADKMIELPSGKGPRADVVLIRQIIDDSGLSLLLKSKDLGLEYVQCDEHTDELISGDYLRLEELVAEADEAVGAGNDDHAKELLTKASSLFFSLYIYRFSKILKQSYRKEKTENGSPFGFFAEDKKLHAEFYCVEVLIDKGCEARRKYENLLEKECRSEVYSLYFLAYERLRNIRSKRRSVSVRGWLNGWRDWVFLTDGVSNIGRNVFGS